MIYKTIVMEPETSDFMLARPSRRERRGKKSRNAERMEGRGDDKKLEDEPQGREGDDRKKEGQKDDRPSREDEPMGTSSVYQIDLRDLR